MGKLISTLLSILIIQLYILTNLGFSLAPSTPFNPYQHQQSQSHRNNNNNNRQNNRQFFMQSMGENFKQEFDQYANGHVPVVEIVDEGISENGNPVNCYFYLINSEDKYGIKCHFFKVEFVGGNLNGRKIPMESSFACNDGKVRSINALLKEYDNNVKQVANYIAKTHKLFYNSRSDQIYVHKRNQWTDELKNRLRRKHRADLSHYSEKYNGDFKTYKKTGSQDHLKGLINVCIGPIEYIRYKSVVRHKEYSESSSMQRRPPAIVKEIKNKLFHKEQQQFLRYLDKIIRDGHLKKVCPDGFLPKYKKFYENTYSGLAASIKSELSKLGIVLGRRVPLPLEGSQLGSIQDFLNSKNKEKGKKRQSANDNSKKSKAGTEPYLEYWIEDLKSCVYKPELVQQLCVQDIYKFRDKDSKIRIYTLGDKNVKKVCLDRSVCIVKNLPEKDADKIREHLENPTYFHRVKNKKEYKRCKIMASLIGRIQEKRASQKSQKKSNSRQKKQIKKEEQTISIHWTEELKLRLTGKYHDKKGVLKTVDEKNIPQLVEVFCTQGIFDCLKEEDGSDIKENILNNDTIAEEIVTYFYGTDNMKLIKLYNHLNKPTYFVPKQNSDRKISKKRVDSKKYKQCKDLAQLIRLEYSEQKERTEPEKKVVAQKEKPLIRFYVDSEDRSKIKATFFVYRDKSRTSDEYPKYFIEGKTRNGNKIDPIDFASFSFPQLINGITRIDGRYLKSKRARDVLRAILVSFVTIKSKAFSNSHMNRHPRKQKAQLSEIESAVDHYNELLLDLIPSPDSFKEDFATFQIVIKILLRNQNVIRGQHSRVLEICNIIKERNRFNINQNTGISKKKRNCLNINQKISINILLLLLGSDGIANTLKNDLQEVKNMKNIESNQKEQLLSAIWCYANRKDVKVKYGRELLGISKKLVSKSKEGSREKEIYEEISSFLGSPKKKNGGFKNILKFMRGDSDSESEEELEDDKSDDSYGSDFSDEEKIEQTAWGELEEVIRSYDADATEEFFTNPVSQQQLKEQGVGEEFDNTKYGIADEVLKPQGRSTGRRIRVRNQNSPTSNEFRKDDESGQEMGYIFISKSKLNPKELELLKLFIKTLATRIRHENDQLNKKEQNDFYKFNPAALEADSHMELFATTDLKELAVLRDERFASHNKLKQIATTNIEHLVNLEAIIELLTGIINNPNRQEFLRKIIEKAKKIGDFYSTVLVSDYGKNLSKTYFETEDDYLKFAEVFDSRGAIQILTSA